MDAILLILGAAISLTGLVLTVLGIASGAAGAGGALLTGGLVALVGGLILAGLAAILWQLLRIAHALEGRPLLPQAGSAENTDFRAPAARAAAAIAGAPAAAATPPATEPIVRGMEKKAPAFEARTPRVAAKAPSPALRPLETEHEPVADRSAAHASRELPNSWIESAPASSARRPGRDGRREIPPASQPYRDEDRTPASPEGLKPAAAVAGATQGPSTAAAEDAPAAAAHHRAAGSRTRSLLDRLWAGDRSPAPSPPADAEMPQPSDAAPAPSIEDLISRKIFKSGVIDGMPYTLYIDGSIEAELPHGLVRFASLDELRAQLAKRNR